MNSANAPKMDLRLRLAKEDDVHTIFTWRNDPWVVSRSANRRGVTWEEHSKWFASVLDCKSHLLFIVQTNGCLSVGTARLDRAGNDVAILTIYLLEIYTGQGLGPRAIEAACREAFERWDWLDRILAYVHRDNEPSQKAFARSGFHGRPPDHQCPEQHLELVRARKAS